MRVQIVPSSELENGKPWSLRAINAPVLEAEAKKLCDEVIATINVAANLNLDRRVARVVSRTLSRDKVFKECLKLISGEYYDEQSRHYAEVREAHADLREGRNL
jgi:hypothetical protein